MTKKDVHVNIIFLLYFYIYLYELRRKIESHQGYSKEFTVQ